MKRRVGALLALAAALLCGVLGSEATAGGRNVNISTDGKGPETCDDIRIRFDHREGVRAEEDIAGVKPGTQALRVRLPEQTGVWVSGSSGDTYSVKACKAALRAETLEKIVVSYANGRLSAAGPVGDDDWAVHFLIRAPRDARLDLEASHGPIGVRDLDGAIRARNQNGPLSFRRCSGTIDAETENGPISLAETSGEVSARAINGPISMSGASGRLRLEAQNGPLSITLSGDRWDGDLDGRTVNGPLTLRLPDNYRSGVRVDISGGGPVNCREEACRAARKSWDEGRKTIEFGEGDPAVRLSVANGPVSIRSSEGGREK